MRRPSKNPTPLAVARCVAGLRQSDLAEIIERSPAYIHRLENGGAAHLTPEIADKIASAVGAPAFTIFRSNTPAPPAQVFDADDLVREVLGVKLGERRR